MCIVLVEKVDDRRTHYLQQAEELAHFAQLWESVAVNKRIGKEVFSAIRDRRFTGTSQCYIYGEVRKIKEFCPQASRQGSDDTDLTLAISDGSEGIDRLWVLDSGCSLFFAGDEIWLDDLEDTDDMCEQPDGQPLRISKKGSGTLTVTALGKQLIVELTNVYYAKGSNHNLVSYRILDKKGTLSQDVEDSVFWLAVMEGK